MARSDTEFTAHEQLIGLLETAIVRITLVVLFTIPLIFPIGQTGHVFGELKSFTLHVGMLLVAVLWAWQLSLAQHDRNRQQVGRLNLSVTGWGGRSTARWTIVAMVVMWLTQGISTLLSPLPLISFFGGDESFSGYNLYDSFGLLILFLVVAFKFRTRQRLEWLLYALIGSATIAAAYGIAQQFGWDPLGNRLGGRVLSSFGNTINFSAYVGMAMPATLAISARRSRFGSMMQVVVAVALALQFAGMWFSDSRGPLVGLAAGVAVLFVGLGLLRPGRDLLKCVTVTAVGLVGAVLIVLVPSNIDGDRSISPLDIGNEITNIGAVDSTSISGRGLGSRWQNWKNSIQITRDWGLPTEQSTLARGSRFLFGLGPEIYPYSFPLIGDPKPDLSFSAHPHNYPLQILFGQGTVGLLLLIVAAGLIFVTTSEVVARMRRQAKKSGSLDWIVIALAAGLFGKIVEMQTGVARVSDLAMTFALAGGLIAITEMVRSDANFPEGSSSTDRTSMAISGQAMFRVALSISVVVTILAGTLAMSWDIRRLSASLQITFAERAPDGTVGLSGLVRAQERAPERRTFTMTLANEYFVAAGHAWSEGRAQDARNLALEARNLLTEFEQRDPFERNTQLALAKTASTLVDWGSPEYSDEMGDRYSRLAEMFPTYPALVATSATAMARVGDNRKAIELANQAIATEPKTKPWPVAWYAKGAALINLDSYDEAIEALTTSIEKDSGSAVTKLAHGALAFIYRQRGDTELAEFHSAAAAS